MKNKRQKSGINKCCKRSQEEKGSERKKMLVGLSKWGMINDLTYIWCWIRCIWIDKDSVLGLI